MIPNKLPPLPKKLFNQDWTISIGEGKLSEDGEVIFEASINARCWYTGKAHQVMNAEKQIIRLEGTLIALGDLFPTLSEISTGIAKKGEQKPHKIYKCERPLNPDGTVYATVLELM
jgi:hypothetical protein